MDMNTCIMGEKLLLRNGEIATYISKFNDNVTNHPHIILLDDTKNEVYRTDEGYMVSGTKVKILNHNIKNRYYCVKY